VPAWRWWWLVPVLGLVPVLLVAVLTQGVVGRQSGPPELTGPIAQSAATLAPTGVATNVSATSGATAIPTTSAITAGAAGASATGSAAAANAASSTSSGASTIGTSSTPNATSASTSGAANTSATAPFVAYRVQYGDTLRTISHTYGVSMAVIAKASGLQDINHLQPGQTLTIPKQPGWLYRVQADETLDQIASRNNVSTDAVASASGLTTASVRTGDLLLIPDPSQAVSDQSK
jgi:LysM repeat protein